MTDNEIIKVLECCSDEMGCTKGCPCLDEKKGCKISNEGLSNYALDLINRLQTKIEHYKKSRDKYQDDVMYLSKQCDELQAENERLKPLEENLDKLLYMLNAVDMGQSVLEEQKHTIKSDAIKEFAENAVDRVEKARLKYQMLCKEQGEKMEEHMHIHFNGIIKIIKDIVKEMVGDV